MTDTCNHFDVGSRKQLFMDSKFIESSRGIEIKMNPPIKSGPILVPETEIEGHRVGTFGTVLEVDGQYRLYYIALPMGFAQSDSYVPNLLAVSDDGINWKREKVGLIEYQGSKDNNLVGISVATFFIDPSESNGYRFKALAQASAQQCERGQYGMTTWHSKDGIKWEPTFDGQVIPFCCDTQNQCFYDTRIQKYVSYLRSWDPKWLRTVSRCEVDDFYMQSWPHGPLSEKPGLVWAENMFSLTDEFPVVLSADEFDPPATDIYTPSVVQYPWADDAYFSFPSPYRHYDGFDSHGRDNRGKRENDGAVSIQMAISRDGTRWNRFRDDYVAPGYIGEIDGGGLYMCVGMLRRGDYIYQYYGALPTTHGAEDVMEERDLGMYARTVQRLDGFVSADAGAGGGEIVTPVIKFNGSKLEVNIDCGAMGEAWVEMLTPDGLPIPGFTMNDSISLERNSVAQEVWWKNGPDVSSLTDKEVRMRIKMRSAKLYAFQFVD